MSLAISVELRSRVRKRDHSRCAYCLTPEELTVTNFEIDHIIPVSAGGETTLNNLCLCCPTCNRHKGYRTKAIDPQTGQAIPLYHPRQQKWAEHFAWSEDKLQIIGITHPSIINLKS